MNHEMNLNDKPFERIKKGYKKIEVRLYDEKRRKINVGDQITFTNLQTNEKVDTKVIGLMLFGTFNNLYSSFPPSLRNNR